MPQAEQTAYQDILSVQDDGVYPDGETLLSLDSVRELLVETIRSTEPEKYELALALVKQFEENREKQLAESANE